MWSRAPEQLLTTETDLDACFNYETSPDFLSEQQKRHSLHVQNLETCLKISSISKWSSDSCVYIHEHTGNRKCWQLIQQFYWSLFVVFFSLTCYWYWCEQDSLTSLETWSGCDACGFCGDLMRTKQIIRHGEDFFLSLSPLLLKAAFTVLPFWSSIRFLRFIRIVSLFSHESGSRLFLFLYLGIWNGGVCLWTGCDGGGGSCCDGGLSEVTGWVQKTIGEPELQILYLKMVSLQWF